jgi:hypothetical protein
MSRHDHQQYVEGCFRCDLSRQEVAQHHADDGCLDEVVRLSADAGLYDQQADLCKTCGQLNSDHGIPDQGDDL